MCLEIEIEQKLKTKDEGAVVANRPVHPTPHKLPVITMLWLLSLDLIEREIAKWRGRTTEERGEAPYFMGRREGPP